MASLTRCQPHLGTYVEVTVSADTSDEKLIDASNAAFSAIEKIDRLMSFHSAESELTMINKTASQQPVQVSSDMNFVIEQALFFSRNTNGVFDITIAPELITNNLLPDHGLDFSEGGTWKDITLSNSQIQFKQPVLLDLGGIAKGYAVDCAMNAVEETIDITVNAGGDLRMRPWRDKHVSMRHPKSPRSVFVDTVMKNCASATSASYDSNIDSIIISRDSQPNPMKLNNKSVTVFAENCLTADALTKVAYLNPDMLRRNAFSGVRFASLDSAGTVTWD
jgi:thiamine biosynthesis lipoprotein|tara:strand:- start:420 stop:1253 length:834 start_codon:yes stop_codon:yes gene_type:complete